MKSGITPSGFEYEIDETTLDNMELVDALAELDSGSPFAISTVSKLLLGTQQRERIYAKIKAEHSGRVPTRIFTDIITEIFMCLGKDGKK